MTRMTSFCAFCALLALVLPFRTAAAEAEAPEPPLFTPWEEIQVPVGNERDGFNDTISARQLFSNPEYQDGAMVVPYMSKAPDEDRIILSVSTGANFNQPLLLESTDGAESWHPMPGVEHVSGTGLSCIGNGVMLQSDGARRSEDMGKSWKTYDRPFNPRFGQPIYGWDPALVDPKSNGKHLYFTGHFCRNFAFMEERLMPVIRESFDAGLTWTDWQGIPEFVGCSEVALAYNAQGEMVAGIRASTMMSPANDQSDRLETSISTDGGKTWSAPQVVAGNGRHHPCMVLLPDGRMVMTYVVRKGYPVVDGKFAYGIEAVISYDGGHTWDTDHRYILARWTHDCFFTTPDGGRVQKEHYYGAPQCTSTIYIPESGMLVTAYGTAQHADHTTPRGTVLPFQTSLILWKPLPKEQYSGVKSPAPAPIPADEAYAQLQNQRRWPVNYVAAAGLPDCGWKDTYAEALESIVDGQWMRLDNRVLKGGLFSLRGIDALEQINAPFGVKMRLNIPSCPNDGGGNRLHIYGILGTGQDRFMFFLAFDRNANISGGTYGAIELPTQCDVPFTLEAWVDNLSKTARFWVDGALVCEKSIDPAYKDPKTAAVLYFGAGSKAVGGFIDIAEFKLGVISDTIVDHAPIQ